MKVPDNLKCEAESAYAKWKDLGQKWQHRFLMDDENPSMGSWLDMTLMGGSFALGCKCCKYAGVTVGAFPNYLVKTPAAMQAVNFLKHHESPKHQAAVISYLSDSPDSAIGAPSVSEFNDLCDEIAHGHGTCSERKRAKMTFCLAESIKSFDQDYVDQSDKIGLIRDESKARLSLRFRTVARTLEVHSGTLGTAKDFGSGAAAICDATLATMNRFCSRFHGAPGKPRVKSFVKKTLFQKLRQNIIVITVDSAGDECLASEMMRSSALSNTHLRATPYLKFVVRDKAHASKRLVSRGWGVDPYLNKVMGMYARDRASIARTIQNSHIIRLKFKQYVGTSFRMVSRTVSNMRSAKHRFESLQKPFGRTVLFCYPTIRTGLWTYQTRDDQSSANAKIWLEYVDTENALQAAMMADASDQTIVLSRLLDNEDVDPAILNHEVRQYVQTNELLFGDSAKCLTAFGYTRAMMDTLSKPLVWTIGSKTYSIGKQGGVPAEIIERCLGRMRCWLKLMKSTVAAEFPSFEVASVWHLADVEHGLIP